MSGFFPFCPVHGLVGIVEQCVCRAAVLRKNRYANAWLDAQADADVTNPDGAGCLNRPDDFFRDCRDVTFILYLHQDVEEFIAPMTADRVIVAGVVPESSGDRLQDKVAHVVPVRIIDLLEVIEINEHHGQ